MVIGGHDGGYATLLRSLDTEGLLEKVTILRSYKRMAADIENMRLPSITIDGLFLENRLAPPLPGLSSGSSNTSTTRMEGPPSDTGYEYPRSRTFPPRPPLPPSYSGSHTDHDPYTPLPPADSSSWDRIRSHKSLAQRMQGGVGAGRPVSPSEISLPGSDQEEDDWFEANRKADSNVNKVRVLM